MRLAVAELKRMTHGTVFDTITKATFSSLELRLPRAEIREHTLQRLVSLDGQMQASLRESRTLAQLRDTLLPALLSGRIRIPVAAELMEAS